MYIHFSLWDFHSWFKRASIPHKYHIVCNKRSISGLRFGNNLKNKKDYAVVSIKENETHSHHHTVKICHGDSYIIIYDVDVQTIIYECNNMMFTFHEWAKTLKKINIKNSPNALKELLHCTEEVFQFPIMLVRKNEIITQSPSHKNEIEKIKRLFDTNDILINDSIETDTKLREIYHRKNSVITKSPYFEDYTILINNIWVAGNCFVKLIAFNKMDQYTPSDVYIFNRLAESIKLYISKNKRKFVGKKFAPYIFGNYIRNNQLVDKHDLDRALNELGWNIYDKYIVYYFEPKDYWSTFDIIKITDNIKRHLTNVCVLTIDTQIVIISNIKNKDVEIEKSSLLSLAKKCKGYIAQSCIGNNFHKLYLFYRQAKYTVEKARERNIPYVSAEEHVSEYTYESIHCNQWLQSLVLPEVRTLEMEDKKKKSQLCNTLYVYLINGCNGVATSKQLKIHRSTLNYRLEKIKDVIGEKIVDIHGKELLLISLLISNNALK